MRPLITTTTTVVVVVVLVIVAVVFTVLLIGRWWRLKVFFGTGASLCSDMLLLLDECHELFNVARVEFDHVLKLEPSPHPLNVLGHIRWGRDERSFSDLR